MIHLWRVQAVYAENPESPVVLRPILEFVSADDRDEAILKSGINKVILAAKKEPSTAPFDARWITFIVEDFGPIKSPQRT